MKAAGRLKKVCALQEGLRLAVDAVEHLRLEIGEVRRRLQPVHAQLGVDGIEDRHDAGAERDRHADRQQIADDLQRGVGPFLSAGLVGLDVAGRVRRGQIAVMTVPVPDHIAQRHHRADRHAQDRARRARRQALARADQHRGEDQAEDDLEEHLQHLVDGRGDHVAVALAVAAVGRDKAHQQDRRGHRADAQRGVRIFKVVGGQPFGESIEHEGEKHADNGEGRQRDAEGLFLLPHAAVRVGLRHHARERHGQTGRREREEDVVDAVSAQEHRIALVAENVAEGYLVDGAQHLHDDHAHGEDRRAVHVVLLSALCHVFPPVLLRRARENALLFDYTLNRPSPQVSSLRRRRRWPRRGRASASRPSSRR